MKVVQGIKAGFLFALAASLAACGPSPQPQAYVQQPAPQVQYAPAPQTQYAPAQQPVVVQQHDGIGTGTALAGAAVIGAGAYMAGKAMAEKDRQATNTTVYRDRPAYVQPNTTPTPNVAPPVAKPAAPVAAPTPAPAPKQAFVPQAAKSTATVTPMRTAPSTSSSFKPTSVTKRR